MAEKTKPSKLELIKKKARASKTHTVVVDDDAGTSVDFVLEAVPGAVYDMFVSKCPPRPQDKKDGINYDLNKFAPMLIAEALVDPEMTEQEVKDLIWDSDSWNRGERMALFSAAVEVSSTPLRSTKRG